MGKKLSVSPLLLAAMFMSIVAVNSNLSAQTVKYHGANSVYTNEGLTILWAVLKGSDNSHSLVYVRIARTGAASNDLKAFSVVARDVFSGDEADVVRRRILKDQNTVTEPRPAFADKAQRRFLFYKTDRRESDSKPAVEIYYFAVPDTTPEFLALSALERYFSGAVAAIRTSP